MVGSRRQALKALVAATALVMSACSTQGLVLTGFEDQGGQYSRREVFYALDGRDVETVVSGTLFGIEPAVFARGVTDVMDQVAFGPRADFSITPDETARRNYRVVMVFDPAEPVVSQQLCLQPNQPTLASRNDGRTYLQAAFCHGPNMLSGVTGWTAQLTRPDDPRFDALVRRVTFDLFPRDRRDDDDCRRFIGDC